MPARLRVSHERDVQQLRRQLAGLPLLLRNEVKFNSVEHLRKCVAEFLQKTAAGEQLRPGGAAEKAILALLDYHPKSFFKKGGRDKRVVGAKVGLHEKKDAQGHQQKCFFVIRKNIQTGEEDEEDFSVQKCIAELAKDPPCDREALAQLLKTRNGLAAEKRLQAAAQAATRKRNREEAARLANSAAAAPAAAAAPSDTDKQQQQAEGTAAAAAAAEAAAAETAAGAAAAAAKKPESPEAAANALQQKDAVAAAAEKAGEKDTPAGQGSQAAVAESCSS